MSRKSIFWTLTLSALLWLAVLGAAFAQEPGVIVNGQGTASLSWQRPTQNTDGTTLPLEDIAGYRVYWGEDQANLTSMFDIGNGAVTSSEVTLSLDGPTTVYFAMTAIHVNGAESALSNIASKTFELEVDDGRVPNPPEALDVQISVTCETDTPGVTCSFTVQ